MHGHVEFIFWNQVSRFICFIQSQCGLYLSPKGEMWIGQKGHAANVCNQNFAADSVCSSVASVSMSTQAEEGGRLSKQPTRTTF